jgi:hypothetical protein
MAGVTKLAGAAPDRDPRQGLAAVASLKALLESVEALQVANARMQGWSWQEIAVALGGRARTVHWKHRRGAGR